MDGAAVRLASVRDAKRAGIALIHQELMLAPNLDIAGNIFLGNEARPLGLLSPLRRRSTCGRRPRRSCCSASGSRSRPQTPRLGA